MTNPAPITLAQLFRFYRGLPHQLAAISEMEDDIRQHGYDAAMRRDRPWFAAWSQDGKQSEPAAGAVLPTTVELPGFPWFPQLDNGPEGWRQCQTSSVAMCLRFLKVPGINDDTDYLRLVERHGDTTDQAAHAKALAELKVPARFTRTLSLPALREQIRAGRPVAIGMLHHGPASAPTGGGHYIAVYGFTPTHLLVNDPYGEQDLAAGGWARQGGDSGRGQRYSIANVTPRWLPEGPASGWAWLFG